MTNIPTKLSQLSTNSSPALGDFVAGVLANLTADDKVSLQSLLTLFANNLAVNSYGPYKASAYLNGSQTSGSGGTPFKILLDTKIYDTSSNFDAVTNHRFVAPIAGIYHVSADASVFVVNSTDFTGYIFVNGSNAKTGSFAYNSTGGNASISSQISADLKLNANDYVELYGNSGRGSITINTGPTANYMDISLMYAT